LNNQDYSVEIQRADDGNTVTAAVREFNLAIGSKARDMSVGFNPVEALLSAAGACMTSSLGLVARNSSVEIDNIRIHAVGTRQPDPPKLIAIRLDIEIASPASDEKLERLVRIAGKATTVVGTFREALDVRIEWRRLPSANGGDSGTRA
jgi:uncharacterized OsmC-like protein